MQEFQYQKQFLYLIAQLDLLMSAYLDILLYIFLGVHTFDVFLYLHYLIGSQYYYVYIISNLYFLPNFLRSSDLIVSVIKNPPFKHNTQKGGMMLNHI